MAARAGLPRSTALPNELLAVETRFGLEGITPRSPVRDGWHGRFG